MIANTATVLIASTHLWLSLFRYVPLISAVEPTVFLDIRRTRSLVTGITNEYIFRVTASESNFAPSPPQGPQSANNVPLSVSSSKLPSDVSSYLLVFPPDSDAYLCNEAKGLSNYLNPTGSVDFNDVGLLYKKYTLVPRGQCSFEAKARSAQRLGAAGIIIYNTLDSRYKLLNQSQPENMNNGQPDWGNTQWPQNQFDYECGTNNAANGVGMRAKIDTAKLSFDPSPYNGDVNNPILSGTEEGNLCAVDYEASKTDQLLSFHDVCPSNRCLLTGKNVSEDGALLEACCAWDLNVIMSSDADNDGDAIPQWSEEDIVIPALFVTMDYGDQLILLMEDAADNTGVDGEGSIQYISVVPYAKWHPNFHYSAVFLFITAVFLMWISCYESSKEYRRSWNKINMAVNQGVLIFMRNSIRPTASGDGIFEDPLNRRRADTDDTVDLEEDIELEMVHNSPDFNVQMIQSVETADDRNNTDSNRYHEGYDSNFEIGDNDAQVQSSTLEKESEPTHQDEESNSHQAELLAHDQRRQQLLNVMVQSDETQETNNTLPAISDNTVIPANISEAEAVTRDDRPNPPVHEALSSTLPLQEPIENQQHQSQNVRFLSPSLLRSTNHSSNQGMELTASHAVIFVLCASAILFSLFFFRLIEFIIVFYGLGGSMCMSRIIFKPFYIRVFRKFYNYLNLSGKNWKCVDVMSFISGYSIGIAWIVVAFSHVQPLSNTFYWIIQDVMGGCFSILILSLIRINSIKVATIFLILVFLYDIFYVFVSPYIFGTSIMVDVALGGMSGDDTFCEKYPSDSECLGSQAPLPMIIVFPWILDFRGGYSMIGLGDIILPGLLISLAARYDGAKAILKKCSQASSITNRGFNVNNDVQESSRVRSSLSRVTKSMFKGYFGPLLIAYAIGLTAAFVAVHAMNKGQPALLYIVPSCLGTIFLLGLKKRELSELWMGPKLMQKANKLVALAEKIPEIQIGAARAAETNLPHTRAIT